MWKRANECFKGFCLIDYEIPYIQNIGQILPPPSYLLPAPHIIFLFHDCPSWNYINTLIIFWNCEPDGGASGSHLKKKIQTGQPHPVLNPDRKILKFAVDSPSNPKSTTLIINITYKLLINITNWLPNVSMKD